MLHTTEHVLTPMGKRYSGVGDLGGACTPRFPKVLSFMLSD